MAICWSGYIHMQGLALKKNGNFSLVNHLLKSTVRKLNIESNREANMPCKTEQNETLAQYRGRLEQKRNERRNILKGVLLLFKSKL